MRLVADSFLSRYHSGMSSEETLNSVMGVLLLEKAWTPVMKLERLAASSVCPVYAVVHIIVCTVTVY